MPSNTKKTKVSITLLLTLSLILLTFQVPLAKATEDSWTTKAPMQQARAGLGVAVVNGKIYAIGGSIGSGIGIVAGKTYAVVGSNGTQFVSTNEEYDPATDTWTFKASMPTPRCSFGIAVYQDKIYCIGGELNNGSGTRVNEVYDPATDTWETKAPMPRTNWALTANVVDGKIYLIGGVSSANFAYDPLTDSWTTKASIPNPEGSYGCASVVVDDKIYLIGAFSDESFTLNQIYDPETDSWSFGSPTPSNVLYAAAGATTGLMAPKRIYVFGLTLLIGGGSVPPFANQVYDPENDGWTVGTSMPTSRINFGVAVVNDTIYAVGGDTHYMLGQIYPSAINEQYTPVGYIPEFPSWTPLLIMLIGVLVVTVIYKQKLKQNQRRDDQ